MIIKYNDFLKEYNKHLYKGDEVWNIANKGGSEHNDSLEYLEDTIKRNDYYLIDLSVKVAIQEIGRAHV